MIQHRTDELDRFKRLVNLTAFAASMGYRLDRTKSSRNCAVMEIANGDKVAITRQPNGHWTYFSVRDDSDNGTIIDFLQRRTGQSLGEVRKVLRAWTGGGLDLPELAPAPRDMSSMLREWLDTRPVEGRHAFLEARGLSSALTDPRFTGSVRADVRGNAIFPHHDQDGNLTGFERRNHDFKGFSAGGSKGMWMSAIGPDDIRLVICESPLDCMAYHVLRGDKRTRYMATGGAVSPAQMEIIRYAIGKMPGLVVVATDNDSAGEVLFRQIDDVLGGRAVRVTPTEKDWTAMLEPMGQRHAGLNRRS